MISQTIARRYAQALFAIGREDGDYTKYGEELSYFTQILVNSELAEALSYPIYPADIRRKILDEVVSKLGLSTIVNNFIGLLQDKGRTGHMTAINDYYHRLVDELNNVKRASITTAGPISEAIQNQVKATLEKMTGKVIILEADQNPEIIGGVIAQVGDLTLDGSIKTQLVNLKESLVKG